MQPSLKNYIYATPRHYRTLYFVEHDIDRDTLLAIIHGNLRLWGGRYNAIIPVQENKIDNGYLQIANALDPDIVFYTENVDIQEIKKITDLHPTEYVRIDARALSFLRGIDYHYLLSDSNRDFMNYYETLPILHIEGRHLRNLEAREFYQTNFGLFELFANQEHFIRGFDVIHVTEASCKPLNQSIAVKNPYFKSILSQLDVDACIFRSRAIVPGDTFELIVSDPSKSNDDLFYFWNRQQYIEPGRRLRQFIVTLEDLEVLKKDDAFGHFLDRMKIQENIFVTSRTIPADETIKIKDDLQNRFRKTGFTVARHSVFPYAIDDYKYTHELKDQQNKQIFTEDADLLKIPAPQLTSRLPPKGEYWIDLDIQVDKPGESQSSALLFPFNYQLHNARINKQNKQSLQIDMGETSIEFRVPRDTDIILHRLSYKSGPDATPQHTAIGGLKYSNAGQKFNALLNLFKNNWNDLFSYLGDKYWLDILRYTSAFPNNSGIPVGKGIFSYKDLQNERRLLYEYHWKAIQAFRKIPDENVDVKKEIDRFIKDDFEFILGPKIQDLIKLGGLFMGIKIKCHTCGSNKWYSLGELEAKLPCKGCSRTVIPSPEAPYYYRVNEIIVNNLKSDVTKNSNDYDGNYIVLRALNALKTKSRKGFSFCAPLAYQKDEDRADRWAGDIDILAIQDGKLIIGEAKLDASEFNRKEIDSLIWLANTIEPDQVILAHRTGTLVDEKLKKLRDGITVNKCEVITYKAEEAAQCSGGLFGLGLDPGGTAVEGSPRMDMSRIDRYQLD